jgi:hypothetical protein
LSECSGGGGGDVGKMQSNIDLQIFKIDQLVLPLRNYY